MTVLFISINKLVLWGFFYFGLIVLIRVSRDYTRGVSINFLCTKKMVLAKLVINVEKCKYRFLPHSRYAENFRWNEDLNEKIL